MTFSRPFMAHSLLLPTRHSHLLVIPHYVYMSVHNQDGTRVHSGLFAAKLGTDGARVTAYARRPDPPAPRAPSNRRVLMGALAIVGAAAVIWFVLIGLYGEQAAQVQLHAIRTAGTLLIGAGGAVTLLLIARRQRRDAIERRITAQCTEAADQLGSDKAPARLAGLHALERLAQNAPDRRQTIVDMICAYLRMPYTPPDEQPPAERAPGDANTRDENRHQEHQVRLTAQSIVSGNLRVVDQHHRRWWHRTPPPAVPAWPGIRLDLTGAVLVEFSLAGCQLYQAELTNAQFIGRADFTRAKFIGTTNFTGVQFTDVADFTRAQFIRSGDFRVTDVTYFTRAQFADAAHFTRAQFADAASFEDAQFIGTADFEGARFIGGMYPGDAEFTFAGAQFTDGANFKAVHFTGRANFRSAHFTARADFGSAHFSDAADFMGARFTDGTDFRAALFINQADYTDAQFTGSAYFGDTRFTDVTSFKAAQFTGSVSFEHAQFTDETYFEEARVSASAEPNNVWPPGWATRPANPAAREALVFYLHKVHYGDSPITSTPTTS